MSSEPRPDEPHLIWSERGQAWWSFSDPTPRVEHARRYPRWRALEIVEERDFLRAVPFSVALRDGPPVESGATIRPVEVLPGDESEVDLAPLFRHARMVVCPDCGDKRCPRATDRGIICMEPRPIPAGVTVRMAPESEPYPWERPARTPLSREAQEARRPPPPETLVDALHDTIHQESGRGRAARTVRVQGGDWSRAEALPYEEPPEIQPVGTYDLVAHLHRQRQFSRRTFGPGSSAARILDHARKEIAEIERDPTDLEEWIDLATLAFDGAWRQGYTSGEIAAAFEAKLAKNERRTWPDWRTADPDKAIEHVRGGEPPNGESGDE